MLLGLFGAQNTHISLISVKDGPKIGVLSCGARKLDSWVVVASFLLEVSAYYWGAGPPNPSSCGLDTTIMPAAGQQEEVLGVVGYLLLGELIPQTPSFLAVQLPFPGPARGTCPPAPPTGGR